MIVETYIDAGGYNDRGGLILQDEHGRQWGVEDAIRSYMDTNCSGEKLPDNPQVILERWRLKLNPLPYELPGDLDKALPKVYKHSILLFRSLFAYLKMLPAWDLYLNRKRRNLKPSQRIPSVKYRIYIDGQKKRSDSTGFDELSVALDDARSAVTDEYSFETISSPAGIFSIDVQYRRRSDFRTEKSMESVYSSRFIGQDEELFKPSLDRFNRKSSLGTGDSANRPNEVGSLPQAQRELAEIAEKGQVYGSMSTFHGAAGARVSSSPMSALRAARDKNAPSPSDDSPSVKGSVDQRPAQTSRSSLRAEAAPQMGRRTSVSFMPFKTPTLSSSPLQTEKLAKPARQSVGTSALSALAEARKPQPASQASSQARPSPVHAETTPAVSISSSPRPSVGSRYSSSFGHRRARLSVGGSKTEDDDKNSSGKASISSSTQQPGSGILAEAGDGGSSGSLHTDDDNISDFLKLLDQKKDLKSFQTPTDGPSAEAASRRTNAALSKFHRLRDSNVALTDSMSSSLMLQRSSTSSSRQLSSVPPMVAGNSTSISSSPGERMSPRTPHTPAIPSRLSANSIVAYDHPRSQRPPAPEEEDEEDSQATQRGPALAETGAIDIPTSPRPFNPYRRSSSVAQQHRPLIDDDLSELPYGLRSASMGDGEERPPLTMSELIQAVPSAEYMSMPTERTQTSARGNSDGRGGAGGPYRGNRGRGGSSAGRGNVATPQSSSTSLEQSTRAGSGSERGGRFMYSSTRSGRESLEDDEGMLFTMQ